MIFNCLQNILGFQYEYKIPDDYDYGIFKNGTWTGIVGELLEEKIDMSAAAMSITL